MQFGVSPDVQNDPLSHIAEPLELDDEEVGQSVQEQVIGS